MRQRVPDELIAVYSLVGARRNNFDSLMWQVPALSITAQAFLLSIALGVDIVPLARQIAALLAMVSAALALQLMAKQRHHEVLDSDLLQRIEMGFGVEAAIGLLPHATPAHRRQGLGRSVHRLVRLSSYRLWGVGLAVFFAADLAVLAISIFAPSLLG